MLLTAAALGKNSPYECQFSMKYHNNFIYIYIFHLAVAAWSIIIEVNIIDFEL